VINIDTQGVSVFSQTITTPKEAAHVTKQQVNLPENKPIINLNKAPIERTVQVGIVDGDKEYERRGGTIIFTDLTPYINNFDLSKMVGLPRSADELASSKVESYSVSLDSGKASSVIYMKGLLTNSEYQNFEKTLTYLNSNQTDKLIDSINVQKGEDRSNLLKATSAANKNANAFISKFLTFSEKDQKKVIDLSSELSANNKENFIQALIVKEGDINELIDIVNNIKSNNKIANDRKIILDKFLSAVSTENPKNLENLIKIADQLLIKIPNNFIKEFDNISMDLENFDIGSLVDTAI